MKIIFKNIPKLFYWLILSIIFNTSVLRAQELIKKEFKHLKDNTTARIYRKRDVNGQNCAVLIIKHNFKDFKVETGKGYEALEEKTGETWIWVSPDEYRIVIRKEGYLPFEYNLKDKLESLETYELIITDEFGTVIVEAIGSKIWLNNNPVGINNYKARLKQGDYVIKATKKHYADDKRLLTIHAGEEAFIKLSPVPYVANVIIESNPPSSAGATIFINDTLFHKKSPAVIPLPFGEYKITLKKNSFIDNSKVIELNEERNYNLIFDMQKVKLNPEVRIHRRRSNIWLIATLVSTSASIYSYSQMNKLYDEYQTATTNATEIHKKYSTYKIVYPITMGVAGFSLTNFIVQKAKQKKAANTLNLSVNTNLNYNIVGIIYNF